MDEPATIAERVGRVRERMAAACRAAGRDPDSVALVAISKTQPPEAVREAADCGLRVFGENRVQEAGFKIPLCPGHLDWHLVGHLQANKARAAVRLFSTIHSVDSADLLCRIDAIAGDEGRRPRVLLEVNVSGEGSKNGMPPDAVRAALETANGLRCVAVAGFMTMPPYCEDPERARGFFRTLRVLRDRCAAETGFALPELSMGMSMDFEVAIGEGATLVRVGTDLFGSRGSPWRPVVEGEGP
ncbi:MAG: YggS family pyridoxal phosphate-dependent enzyme [Verrucomicrobia bacterium]|nr:YggS family pyridoxal phosphate-dependent enzyme [Verrucomicrobiota bacterium]